MITKFHLNKNGDAGPCAAKKGKCPFGSVDEHYDSLEEARKAYERKMENSNPNLADLVSTDVFKKAINDGHISERAHPDDENLRVYSYTKQVQFSGHWTPETLLARGLILQLPNGDLSKAVIVGRGLPKFFTVEQMAEGDWTRVKLVDDDENVTVSEAPEISWDSPAVVSDKLNGALGLAYVAPDGQLSISTKGSFSSLEAEVGTKVIRNLSPEEQKSFREFALNGKTPLFEIITPQRPHPVYYGDVEELVILGSIDNASGKWSPVEKNSELATKFGFKTAERLKYPTLKEAVRAPYRLNTEGFVVTVDGKKGQELYKVKPPEYHALRRFFYASTPKELSAEFSKLDGKSLSTIVSEKEISFSPELVSSLDPNSPLLAERRKLVFNEIVKPTQELAVRARRNVDAILTTLGNNPEKRDIALKINEAPQNERGVMFKALSDIQSGGYSAFEAARNQVIQNLKGI